MNTIKNIAKPALVAACLAMSFGCIGEMSYQRVDEPPTGAQINSLASSFFAVILTPRVRYLYSHTYEEVWAAANEVMKALKDSGTEPQLKADEANGVIVLGVDHRDEAAKTMDNPNPIRIRGWREEFRLEFTRQPLDRTLVVITRLVLGVPYNRRCAEYADPCPIPILFEPEVSNGQIERWVLTRIKEELDKPILARIGAPSTPVAEENQGATGQSTEPVPFGLIGPRSGGAPSAPSSVILAPGMATPSAPETIPAAAGAPPAAEQSPVVPTAEQPAAPPSTDQPASLSTSPPPSNPAPESSPAMPEPSSTAPTPGSDGAAAENSAAAPAAEKSVTVQP